MAKYKRIVTTEAGLALLENAAYIGGSIQFTALKVGSGAYDGTEELSAMTALKNVRQTFGVDSVSKRNSDIIVRAVINNNGVTEGYAMTEIGLFASDPDTGAELLYAVIVAEEGNEDYFPPYADAPTSITLEMNIGITESEEAVSFTAAPMEGAYVSAESFNEHKENKSNPHGVTKEQLGLGNVPNVTTNDQTPTYTAATANTALSSGEKLSVAFGKIAKAISSLISHLADSTTHVTSSERTTWNAKANSSHNQAASTITAGTLGGQVKANATAQSTLTTAQLRDAVFVAEASAPAVGSTADTSKYPEGCLIVVVEAVS